MADEKRMPHDAEARAFKTAVLQAAAAWLEGKPHLDRSNFNVDVTVTHTAHASEDLSQYLQRDTGDEAK